MALLRLHSIQKDQQKKHLQNIAFCHPSLIILIDSNDILPISSRENLFEIRKNDRDRSSDKIDKMFINQYFLTALGGIFDEYSFDGGSRQDCELGKMLYRPVRGCWHESS